MKSNKKFFKSIPTIFFCIFIQTDKNNKTFNLDFLSGKTQTDKKFAKVKIIRIGLVEKRIDNRGGGFGKIDNCGWQL